MLIDVPADSADDSEHAHGSWDRNGGEASSHELEESHLSGGILAGNSLLGFESKQAATRESENAKFARVVSEESGAGRQRTGLGMCSRQVGASGKKRLVGCQHHAGCQDGRREPSRRGSGVGSTCGRGKQRGGERVSLGRGKPGGSTLQELRTHLCLTTASCVYVRAYVLWWWWW